MSEYCRPLVWVERLACDATGCEAEVGSVRVDAGDRERDPEAVEQVARERGWSCWEGRSVRHYCREHGPRPGHRMTLVWGGPDER